MKKVLIALGVSIPVVAAFCCVLCHRKKHYCGPC